MHSGDQMDGRGHLQVAGNEPQRLVVVVGLGVAGNIAGDELGGSRSRVRTNPGLWGTSRCVEWGVVLLGMR